ncbi:MAG: B12-binding domain-containing radical SAM protein [Clostridia bacterium]|nr:B12-binding domain-containing radical SAM protein [Clostridia bacterium]
MKALFFFPATGYYNRALSNPLGLLSIASFLKRRGHDVKILDRNIGKIDIRREISEFAPDAVGISVMSARGVNDAVKISKTAKDAGVVVIWGGQMPTLSTEMALTCPYVDYVAMGEGEYVWEDILNAVSKGLPIADIPGVASRGENGEVRAVPCRPFADLRDIGPLDFTLLKMEKYTQTYLGCKKMVYLYSAKGCPGRCAFCSNTTFHKSVFRKRPVDFVIQELKFLTENYGVDGVYFSDELWCLRREEMLEFCRELVRSGINIRFGIQMRVGILKEEDYKLLYDCGCRWVFFGIESGNAEMQKRIHKYMPSEKIRETFEMTDRIGLTSFASMIIGYPDETEEQLRDSVRLMNSVKASMRPVYHFTPLPGTEFYREVVERGIYEPPRTLKKMSSVIETESLGVNLSKVPDVDLKVIRSWYNWQAFSDKSALKSGKKFEFALDTIRSGLHSISMQGVFSFFVNGFAAFREFVSTFWYSHAYPDIVKKYELNVYYK